MIENTSPELIPDNAQSEKRLEILAPAGEWAALDAALDAGADAVYLGLTVLNARRRARNFRQEELARAVEAAHGRGARVYLTLNIDLTDRELGQAARILELARRTGVDAVLIRDPALLALRRQYPELEFHFSTQTCMANSADVAAAGHLGALRVVLAREMTLAEIAAASAVPGVQTEVFAQGALCFCVSGRCLLASWIGGHSGNRGTCTSPCRVPWTMHGEPVGTPLSMRDLSTVHRLQDLRRAGVTALKIEGRLKTGDWVHRAVALYRRAVQEKDPAAAERLAQEAAELGAYTGRGMTCGYLDGQRDELTGLAGRPRAPAASPEDMGRVEPFEPDEDAEEGTAGEVRYALEINVEPRGIVIDCTCRGRRFEWTVPKTAVRRAHKALPIGVVLERLGAVPIQDCTLGRAATNDPEFLMVPRAVNGLVDRLSAVLRQACKSDADQVRIDLPEAVRDAVAGDKPSPANTRRLGEKPDRVRLDATAAAAFLRHVRPSAAVVEGVSVGALERLLETAGDVPLVVALPPVFFEEDVPRLRQLVTRCAERSVTVEVNSWGGWWLAREAGAATESGPGLPVLNRMAARVLGRRGIQAVTLSVEADCRELEEVSASSPVACSLVVYGRPPLVMTRVRLPEEYAGAVFEDRRGARITPRREHGLWVFRPVHPFDLRDIDNEKIRVAHLVVDLVGAAEPVSEWRGLASYEGPPFRFNYDRSLA